MAPIQELISADLALAMTVATVAGLMRGFTGFGSGMLMAPVFAILFGPVETVAIVVLMELLVSVQLVPRALAHVQWRFVAALGLAAMVFMPVGSRLLATADPALLTRVMAGLVLVFVVVLMAGWRYEGEKRLLTTLGVGAVSGTLIAATSMGNPPVLLYMLSGRDAAATNRANIIAFFAVTQPVLLGVMGAMGLLSWSPVWRALLLLPGFMLAAWIGSRLFRESGEALYRRIAFVFLLGVAVYGLLR